MKRGKRRRFQDVIRFRGPVPEPINADVWLDMTGSLKNALPDLDYHFKAIGSDGEVVKTTAQLSGTHMRPFDLTSMDMGVIPPTNKTFTTALEKTKVTVRDNKITSWAAEPTEGAGLHAILDQLGVETPAGGSLLNLEPRKKNPAVRRGS